MKNWIKMCFSEGKDPMQELLGGAIGISIILHLLSAPAWTYILLCIVILVLYIIITSK